MSACVNVPQACFSYILRTADYPALREWGGRTETDLGDLKASAVMALRMAGLPCPGIITPHLSCAFQCSAW